MAETRGILNQEDLDCPIPKGKDIDVAPSIFIGEMNQAHNREGFHAFFSAAKAHSLGRLCLDVDSIHFGIESTGEGFPHSANVRGQLRLLSDNGCIHVIDPPSFLFSPGHHLLEHQETVCILERRIIVREVLAYISFPKSTNQCVNDGMGQYVRVGVAKEAHGVRDENPPQDQRTALNKAVGIVSEADATHVFLHLFLVAGTARTARTGGTP